MPFIYYSLVVTDRQDAYEKRWIRSVRSLRQFNSKIPVYLFVFNAPPDSLRDAAERYEVVFRPCGDYRDFTSDVIEAECAALSCLPTFQKFLPLEFVEPEASQILYLDCDTFFFADVASLFRKYRDCDWYAREEPRSRRSTLFPYDPRHVDEDLLLQLGAAVGTKPVPPSNLGVFLFNSKVRSALLGSLRDFFSLAWRLTAGASLQFDVEMPSELKSRVTEWLKSPGNQPLAYPSTNFWILDQIASWLILGRDPSLSHGLFAEEDVLQGPEFLFYRSYRKWCTVAHYYTNLESQFLSDAGVDDASPALASSKK